MYRKGYFRDIPFAFTLANTIGLEKQNTKVLDT
jgi:hypothetical protein